MEAAPRMEPWGKDADMATISVARCECRSCPPSPMNLAAQMIIRFHQTVISPADGPRSNYRPSSSQYALDAIRKYGFLKGFIMGCDRLMRENDDPWVYKKCRLSDGSILKKDPVP